MTYLVNTAHFSECGKYRYFLDRAWALDRPMCCWVMLNPSTADAALDDPTIRKCVGFADRWGYGRITVVNLFAFRATHPKDMRAARDPVGPENDRFILWRAALAKVVVLAWGIHGEFRRRSVDVMDMLITDDAMDAKVRTLGCTKSGEPRHPLMLSYSTPLQE